MSRVISAKARINAAKQRMGGRSNELCKTGGIRGISFALQACFSEQASFMLELEGCKAGASVGLATPNFASEWDNPTAANSPQPTRYEITRHRTIQ